MRNIQCLKLKNRIICDILMIHPIVSYHQRSIYKSLKMFNMWHLWYLMKLIDTGKVSFLFGSSFHNIIHLTYTKFERNLLLRKKSWNCSKARADEEDLFWHGEECWTRISRQRPQGTKRIRKSKSYNFAYWNQP